MQHSSFEIPLQNKKGQAIGSLATKGWDVDQREGELWGKVY